MKLWVTTTLAALIFIISATIYASQDKISYPTDYRQWFHVKTMIIEPGHALEKPFHGLHHVYANKKALSGVKTGDFVDGSTLVFDLLNYSRKDKAIIEENRKLLGIMYKDNNKYRNTGGWGFEGFAGNSTTDRIVKDNGKSCFSCHISEKNHGYVFSKIQQ